MAVHDRIIIRDLLLRGIIGLNDWEREKQQDILINLVIYTDMRNAGRSDDMSDSINYRSLTKDIIAHVEGSAHFLVERLATEIARICVVGHGADRAIVRVEKPGALRFAASTGVEIERKRADFEGEV
ncbi:MAG: dihydroneopterin aldolase [Caldilineae bacterium]|nr:dihydroneopterin aldolase [Chloroflexota bacterium]MCB9176160.1 dihydroneopterin aldolase [Caldilineae bacterium]